jgi:hypothetical protein
MGVVVMTDEKGNEQKNSGGWNLLRGIIILILPIAGLIFGIFALNAIMVEQTPVCEGLNEEHGGIISSVPIYSTEDGTAIRGDFFLGCGRIETYLVYYYYTGDDVTGFHRQMMEATDNVAIFRDSEIPRLVTRRKYQMMPMPPTSVCQPVMVYEFHIPKDTLIKDVAS